MPTTKEELLEISFLPQDCDSMTVCVTKEDALKALDIWAKQECNKATTLLKEARDMLVMASLLDKSGHCMEMVNKIDIQFPKFNK